MTAKNKIFQIVNDLVFSIIFIIMFLESIRADVYYKARKSVTVKNFLKCLSYIKRTWCNL